MAIDIKEILKGLFLEFMTVLEGKHREIYVEQWASPVSQLESKTFSWRRLLPGVDREEEVLDQFPHKIIKNYIQNILQNFPEYRIISRILKNIVAL